MRLKKNPGGYLCIIKYYPPGHYLYKPHIRFAIGRTYCACSLKVKYLKQTGKKNYVANAFFFKT